ncbi:puromycin-sensitive aminopeptidase-like isoform X2, partial [Leptotrombidium deliense]
NCGEKDFFRLSSDVYPTHYDLQIRQDLEKLTFTGIEVIHLEIKSPKTTIKLHSLDLNITSVTFNGNIDASIIYCKSEQTILLNFPTAVVGPGSLQITYHGEISNQTTFGIYALKRIVSGKVRYSSQTTFEPSGARYFFASFDEPSFKATYSISVIAPIDRTVLSNMPVLKQEAVSKNEKK